MGCLGVRCAGLRGESQPIEPDPGHAGGGRDAGAAKRDFLHIAADVMERLRERRPRVHCITNAVAQNFTANMLLAAGAVPSMTIAQKEVRALPRAPTRCWSISAPSMPSGRRRRLRRWPSPTSARIPWVLDPVFIDRSPPRAAFAKTRWRQEAARRCGSTRPSSARCRGGQSPTTPRWRASPGRAAPWWASPASAISSRDGDAARHHRQRPSADGARHRHGLRGLGAGRALRSRSSPMPGRPRRRR